MKGSFKAPQDATPEIQEMVDSVAGNIQLCLQLESMPRCKAISFTNRAVRGGNYIIKTELNEGRIIHVKLNKFPAIVFEGVVDNMTIESPLFDNSSN